MMIGLMRVGRRLYVRVVKFRSLFHYDAELRGLEDWDVLQKFDEELGEVIVYGTPKVFEEVYP